MHTKPAVLNCPMTHGPKGALVPRPWLHLIRVHGVLASNSVACVDLQGRSAQCQL